MRTLSDLWRMKANGVPIVVLPMLVTGFVVIGQLRTAGNELELDDAEPWQRLQDQRRQLVRDACHGDVGPSLDDLLTRPLKNTEDLLDVTLVDDTHKLIYCYVPKVIYVHLSLS